MQHSQHDLIAFLPHFLDDDIYLAEPNVAMDVSRILEQSKQEQETKSTPVEVILPPILPKEIKIISTTIKESIVKENTTIITQNIISQVSVMEEKVEIINIKTETIKVIILVSYMQGIPSAIEDNMYKIFAALAIPKANIAIINVTVANPKLLATYSFEYLVLMGGKGKTLEFLQPYTGKRDVHEVGKIENATVIFAEKLDIYLQTGNEEKKRTFWNALKNAIQK